MDRFTKRSGDPPQYHQVVRVPFTVWMQYHDRQLLVSVRCFRLGHGVHQPGWNIPSMFDFDTQPRVLDIRHIAPLPTGHRHTLAA